MQITFEVIIPIAWEHAKSNITWHQFQEIKDSYVCVGQEMDFFFIEELHFARNDL